MEILHLAIQVETDFTKARMKTTENFRRSKNIFSYCPRGTASFYISKLA